MTPYHTEASDKLHASAVLFPFAEFRYSLHMSLCGRYKRSGRSAEKENLLLLQSIGSRFLSVQLVGQSLFFIFYVP